MYAIRSYYEVTGNEPGSCKRVTGSEYLSSYNFV